MGALRADRGAHHRRSVPVTKGLDTISAEHKEVALRLKTRAVEITNRENALERLKDEQAEDLAKLTGLQYDANVAFEMSRASALPKAQPDLVNHAEIGVEPHAQMEGNVDLTPQDAANGLDQYRRDHHGVNF